MSFIFVWLLGIHEYVFNTKGGAWGRDGWRQDCVGCGVCEASLALEKGREDRIIPKESGVSSTLVMGLACDLRSGLKVPCSFQLTAMGKFALLRYLSEFRLRISSF